MAAGPLAQVSVLQCLCHLAYQILSRVYEKNYSLYVGHNEWLLTVTYSNITAKTTALRVRFLVVDTCILIIYSIQVYRLCQPTSAGLDTAIRVFAHAGI